MSSVDLELTGNDQGHGTPLWLERGQKILSAKNRRTYRIAWIFPYVLTHLFS
jgi:hypothetical protein